MTAPAARDRPLALALIALGAVAALLFQASAPGRRPPLYDGVVVEDPYEWLDPPPGYPSGAEGTSDTVDVVGGVNRIVAVFTSEQPPQAQVLAQRGALKVGADATSLTVTITPVEADVQPSGGYIDGNVYEIQIVDDQGREVSPRKGAEVSIVLRPADDNDLTATIEQLDGTTWRPLRTGGGGPFAFEAVVSSFGDFAVVAKGASPYPTPLPAVTDTPTEPPDVTAEPSVPAVTTELPATAAPSLAPVAASDGGVPIGSLAAIAAGVLGLIALVVLYGRPRRRGRDRWR